MSDTNGYARVLSTNSDAGRVLETADQPGVELIGFGLNRGVAQIKRLAYSLLLVWFMPVLGTAAEPVSLETAERAAAEQKAAELQPVSQPYVGKTDQELTELTAQWDDLSETERRALLIEVKSRMARGNNQEGVIRILTRRRFGRIIRRPDGSVVRIEAEVVQIRPEQPAAESYGVGFEQRAARKEAAQETPPILTVKDPSP